MVRLKERTKRVLKWLGLVILIITAIYLFFTKLIKYVAPFLLAFLIMISIERLVSFLQRRLKFPRSIAVAISLLFFVAAVGGILVLTFYKLINELWRLALEIARMDFNPIIEYFESLFEKGQDLFFSLPDSLIATIEQTLEMSIPKLSQIASEISSWLMGIVMGMIDFVKFLPDVLVFIIVMMVSAYFMSRDRRQISEFLSERIPANWFNKIRSLRDDMIVAFVGFIKAQIFLMAITFLELLIGYQILGVEYAFFFALLTAIIDILPVLGTGTVLIPTAIVHFIMGNIPRALGFLCLYFIIFVIRQILEPRVVGQSLGLHPLVTLMSMYIGLRLIGVPGMFLGPIIVILVKAFYKAGFLPSWKTETNAKS